MTGETWGKTVGADAVQDVVQREVSVGLGDDHVQSWQQVGEDVFGNALGNAAIAGIEASNAHSATQPQPQSSASLDSAPSGDGNWWENGSVFGNAPFGSDAFTPGATTSGTGDYSLIVTSDPTKGYPVPVGYTNDPAVIKALYANTVAYVDYENKQPLYDLPPVPGPDDPQALIDYNHDLQHGLYPRDYGNTLSTINVVPTSEMQQDVAAANERQSETEAALASWQGSIGGDLAYNAVTLLTRGGNDLIASAESVKDILTDRMSAEQAVTGLGRGLYGVATDIAHPIDTYNRAVGAVSDWYGESLDQKAQDIGRFGIDTLVFGGAEGIATKGLGYINTLADGFGSAVDALSTEPMYGSRAAQAGMLDVGAVGASNPLVDSEVNALRRIAVNNSIDTGSAARMARIDELTTANYNRLLQNDLSGSDYAYRAVPENMLDIYQAQGSISGLGGSPTYFSFEDGESPLQQKFGAQLLDEPQVLLKIPTSELVNPTVPRPFGYEPVPTTTGREYFVNSYPQYGAGGFRQFIGTTRSYSNSWIVSPWGAR